MRYRGVDEIKDYKESTNAIAEFTHTHTSHWSLHWTKVCLSPYSFYLLSHCVSSTYWVTRGSPFPLPHGSPSGIWRQNDIIAREPYQASLSWTELEPGPCKTSPLHHVLLLLFSRTCSHEAPETCGLALRASAPLMLKAWSRAEPPPLRGHLCSCRTLSDLDRGPIYFSNRL